MSVFSCLDGRGCLGTTYDFFSKSKIGVTASLVIEVASALIGILAIVHVLPIMGRLPAALMTTAGAGFLGLSLTLVAIRNCQQKPKFNEPSKETDSEKRDLGVKNKSKSLPNASQTSLPTTLYTYSSQSPFLLQYWDSNSLNEAGLPLDNGPYKTHLFPVAASPYHGESFAADGHIRQYIIFNDGQLITAIDFQLLRSATFMKPNVDTMLTCIGVCQLFQQGLTFNKAIDVGAGSGFIAKYIALKFPCTQVTAIDIDGEAGIYMRSERAAMPENVTIVVGDAITKLSKEGDQYDLIVSNPPYVPTEAETLSTDKIRVNNPSFWKGSGLICHMLEETLPKMPVHGHLVILVPSMALKSRRLFKIFQDNALHFQAQVLYQQEVAYKAGYAGDNQVDHLLATKQEARTPTFFKGAKLELFVGITEPGNPRDCQVNDGRKECTGYYWQIVYIIDFVRQKHF